MRKIKFENGKITINNDSVQLEVDEINKVKFYLEMIFVSARARGAIPSKSIPKKTTTKKKTTRGKGGKFS